MKKLIFLLVLMPILFSCVTPPKSIYDLEKTSLKSAYRTDTVFSPFMFGMTRDTVEEIINNEFFGKFNFEVKGLSDYDFEFKPKYYNDSLMGITLSILIVAKAAPDIYTAENIFELKYGTPDTTYTDNEYIKTLHYLWLKGNKEIDLSENSYTFSISYLDLRRNDVGCRYDENLWNEYSSDYYNKVYLPRQKAGLKGI